jgi:hypothetical protein
MTGDTRRESLDSRRTTPDMKGLILVADDPALCAMPPRTGL